MKSKNKVREKAAENGAEISRTKSSVGVETEATVGRGSKPMQHPEPSGALIKHSPSTLLDMSVHSRSLAVQTVPFEIVNLRSEMTPPPLPLVAPLFPTKPALFFFGGFSGST